MATRFFFHQGRPTRYYVDEIGRVFRNGKQLKPSLSMQGYHKVTLWIDRKPKQLFTHRIAALAWIPNPENKAEINHKNGIKTDNRLENLEWVTREENIQHSYRMGLKVWAGNLAQLQTPAARKKVAQKLSAMFQGENSPSARLTNAQAEEIRNRLKNRYHGCVRDICREYGVCRSVIGKINSNKTYRSA